MSSTLDLKSLSRKQTVRTRLTNTTELEAAVKDEIERKIRAGVVLTPEVVTKCVRLGMLACRANFEIAWDV